MKVIKRLGFPLVLIIAGFMRLLPLRFKYLLGSDPYFHFSYLRYVVFLGHWERWYPYVNAPWGLHVTEPVGFWALPFFLWKIFSPLGLSLYNAFRISPVIIGLSTVALTYVVVKKHYGELEAFYSSLLLAVSFGHIFRSMAGYYRGDCYIGLLYVILLLSLFSALKDNLLGYLGIFLSLVIASTVWKAYYLLPVSALFVVLSYGIKSFLKNDQRGIRCAMYLTLTLMAYPLVSNLIGKRLGYGMLRLSKGGVIIHVREIGIPILWFGDVFLFFFFLTATFLLLWLYLLYIAGNSKWGKTIFLFFPILLVILSIHSGLLGHLVKIVGGLGVADINLGSSQLVSEMARPTLFEYLASFGPSFIFFPFFLFDKRDKLIIFSSSIPFLVLSLEWSRFLFLASIPVAMMGGVGLIYLWKFFKSNFNDRKLKAISLMLLFYVPLFGFGLGLENTLAQSPFVNSSWESALTYLTESPHNSIVLTWWYQAYWVPYFSNRSVVDGGGPSKVIARYYLGLVSPSILNQLGVDYVIVSMEDVEQYQYITKTAGHSPGTLMFFKKKGEYYYGPKGMILEYSPSGNLKAVLKFPNGTRYSLPTFVQVEKNRVVFSGGTGSMEAYVSPHDGYAVVFSKNISSIPLVGLLIGNLSGYRLAFSNWGRVKVYAYVHPHVVIEPTEVGLVFRVMGCPHCTLKLTLYSEDSRLVKVIIYNVSSIITVPYSSLNAPLVRYVLYSGKKKKHYFDSGCFNPAEYLRINRQ